MKCDQCVSAYINGVFCHETGCPNTFKDFDLDTGTWLDPEPDPDDFVDYESDFPDDEDDERSKDDFHHSRYMEPIQDEEAEDELADEYE